MRAHRVCRVWSPSLFTRRPSVQAFNFSLALFSLLVVWGKNARGALFAQGFIALALILDIVYFSVNPRRNPTSLAFQALTFIEKVRTRVGCCARPPPCVAQ